MMSLNKALRPSAMLALSAIMCVGCATKGPQGPPSDMFDVTRKPAAWSAWTPKASAALVPHLAHTTAFDHWALEPSEVEGVWQGVYPTLDALRLMKGIPQNVRTSIHALSAQLDPAQGATLHVDVTFLANATELWEGVLVQLYSPRKRGAPAHLAMLIQRSEQARGAGRVTLWGAQGFEQSSAWTAQLIPAQTQASVSVSSALEIAPAKAVETSSGIALMRKLMVSGVWPKVTGQAYLEPTIKRTTTRVARVDAVPVAAGMPLKERSIEEVLSQTSFVPDIGDDDF